MSRILAASALPWSAAAPSHGDVVVTASPTGTTTTWSVHAVGPSLYDVEVRTTAVASPSVFTITGLGSDRIRNLTVVANVPQFVSLVVRGHGGFTHIGGVDSIDSGGSTATVVVRELRTFGDVGAISVNVIEDTDVGGDVTGPVTLKPRNGGGASSIIRMGVRGNFLGPINVSAGEVFTLDVTGTIGAAGAPVAISVRDNIKNIAATEVHADITLDTSGTLGRVRRIDARSGPVSGAWVFKEFADTFGGFGTPGLYVAGDFDATVHLLQSLDHTIEIGGAILPAGMIKINNHLRGTTVPGGKIVIGAAAGLRGHVIVNARHAVGLWTGEVRVNGAPLAHVNGVYGALSATLGGGGVGLAPFRLHAQDCVPPHGSAFVGGVPGGRIVLRFYGPVRWDSGVTPFTVETTADVIDGAVANGAGWSDATGLFGFSQETSPREVVITLPTPLLVVDEPIAYRVRTTAALKCRDVLGEPAVANGEYVVIVNH